MCGILEDWVGEMHLISQKYGAEDGDSAWGELRGGYQVVKIRKVSAGCQLRIASPWAIPQRQYLNTVTFLED